MDCALGMGMADLELKNGWVTAAWVIATCMAALQLLRLLMTWSGLTASLVSLVAAAVFLVCGGGVFLRRSGFALILVLFQALNVGAAVYALFRGGQSLLVLILAPAVLIVFFKAYRVLRKAEIQDARPEPATQQPGTGQD
jgi:uncharacterized membrane protein YfhO